VYISDPNAPAEVNSQKQASAFPPNFIHSLDATHMLLTALECRTQGLAFASVHDSYWTHASSIDQMSTIIRETFIALHSSDVLSRLLNEFRERYTGYRVPVASLKTSQILKQLGIVDTATDMSMSTRRRKNAVEAEPPTSATETADADVESAEEDEELAETVERPPTVSVLSKEQAVQLLKPQARRIRKDQPTAEESLEGKFVDLVDLLPPVPAKGEFDVHKIKSSLYFFS